MRVISGLQVFEVVSNLTQENQELAALFDVQALNGEHCQPFALAIESSVDGVSGAGQLKSDTSPICLRILLYTQQASLFQAFDQTGQLSLVTGGMRDEVAQGRAGMPRKEAQKLAFHVGHVVRAVRQSAILLRTEEMHDGVDQIKHLVRGVDGFFTVDIVNRTTCHGGHYQPCLSPDGSFI